MNDNTSPSTRGSQRVTRRRLLAGLSTATIAGTAGCSDLLSDDNDPVETDDEPEDTPTEPGTEDEPDDSNDEPEYPDTPEPFNYELEDLYIDLDNPWEHIEDAETFSGDSSDRHPEALEISGYTQYERPVESSDSPTLTHTVLIFKTEDTAETYYNNYLDDLETHEHGFADQTELDTGFYENVNQAFAYVLDDEYDTRRFLDGHDERHSGTAIIRIGNLVTTVEHHRIAPGDPESDEYEYHGNTDDPADHGSNLISQWASNNNDISEYLMNT